MNTDNKVIIITGPSGGGKTTLAAQIMQDFTYIKRSVSATTRPPRSGEKEDIDYYFLSKDIFEKKLNEGKFLEWEQVYDGLYYGTLLSEVHKLQENNYIVLFVLDVNGAKRVKDYFGENALSVFVKPPSLEVLQERLLKRGTETEATMQKRMLRAKKEMLYEPEFDAILINDELNLSYRALKFMIEGFIQEHK
jgi:guanylate kinase